jgi:hypothetical protein
MAHLLNTINDVGANRLGEFSSTATAQMIIIGRGESDAYSNSGATSFASGQILRVYDTNPVNTITGASLTSSNDWISAITLPTGVYTVSAFFGAVFTASGELQVNFNNQTSYGSIGASAQARDNGTGITSGRVVVTLATSTISLFSRGATNIDTVANQGNTPAKESYIVIEKT